MDPPAAHPVLGLHGAIGNQGVARLIASSSLNAGRTADEAMRESPVDSVVAVAPNAKGIHRREGDPNASSTSAAGRPLDGSLRSNMERVFDAELGDLRVHENQRPPGSSALAGARGVNLYFARGAHDPSSTTGRRIVAHEVAHVLQQSEGLGPARSLGSPSQLETEAHEGARVAVAGGRARVRRRAAPGLQLTELWEQVEQAATKGEVFDLLRAHGPITESGQLHQVRLVIERRFGPGTDDRWLADRLIEFGAEPRWPAQVIEERVRRAQENAWAPEPGNIAADLGDPARESGITVRAYFFPGRSSRSALVIGGIHGSEPQGTLVVEHLRGQLEAASRAGRPPFFTTILVPNQYERIYQAGWQTAFIGPTAASGNIRDRRFVQISAGRGRTREVEQSRNYPYPGTSYGQARALGRRSGAELRYRPSPGQPLQAVGGFRRTPRMLPEVRILVSLIERFNPERIVQVHGHSTSQRHVGTGAGPGITVDPRGLDPDTGLPRLDPESILQHQEDVALTRLMVLEGLGRLEASPLPASGGRGPWHPFSANTPYERQEAPGQGPASLSPGELTVLYPPGAPGAGRGTSLGGYGPVPVPGVRQGATTINIEVPHYRPAERAAVPQVISLHADLLLDILLQDPEEVARRHRYPPTMVSP